MIDACLVYMPHQPPQTPSEVIGLLSAQLRQRGRTVKAVYANLRFLEAARPGSDKLGFFGEGLLIGDWAFARDVFGEDDSHLDDYVAYLQRADASLRRTTASALKKALLRFRQESEVFLDWLVPDILALEPRVVICVMDHLQTMPSLALLKRLKAQRPDIVTTTCTLANDQAVAQTLRSALSWIDIAIGPAQAEFASDLQAQPIPDHGDYFEELESLPKLKARVEPRLPVAMSRGCRPAGTNPCFFCGIPNARRPYERRTPARVLEELDVLHTRHGTTRFLLSDPMAEMDLLGPLLAECAKRGRPYRFFCQVSPGLTRRHVRALADGGVDWVQPGMESLDSRLLALANKKNRAWQNIQFLKWCGELDVRVNWNFLYGFPGEDDAWYDDVAGLIPALTHLQPPRVIDRIRVCRQSAYFDRAGEFGVEPVPGEAARFVYRLPPGVVEGLTQYFDDGARRRREGDDLEFIGRLGFFSAKKQILEWQRAFRGGTRPHLTARRVASGVIVDDTRPIASTRETLLDGLEASVLAWSRDAPPRSEVERIALERGATPDQLERAIGALTERQFMVPMDGRLISLVLAS